MTFVAVLLLGLGIGVNTAVSTVARQVLTRGPVVENPRDLMQLKFDDLANHVVGTQFSYPAFEMLSRSNPLIVGMYARSEQIQVNVSFHGASDIARAVFENPDGGAVLGIRPAMGRLLNRGDAQSSGESPPVMLSYVYWQRRFGGDPNVIGRAVNVNMMPFVISGVAPANFHGVEMGIDPDVTLPAYTADAIRGIPTVGNRASWGFAILCRRQRGATTEQIRAALAPTFAAILDDFASAVPVSMAGTMKQFASKLRFRVDSAALGVSSSMRTEWRQPLVLLIVITGLVFLVTCANLAGLILAKTESRTAEIGVRLAIGCGRARLLGLLLTESVMIALMGASFGVLAAFWMVPLIPRLLGSRDLSEAVGVRPDASMLAYGLMLAILGGVLLGLTPAVRAMRLDPLLSIRHSSVGSGVRTSTFARVLTVCQVGASIVLCLTAGQFIRSLQNYQAVDAGFRPDHLITVAVRPGLVKYDGARCIAYAREMYTRLASVPGVKSVTFSTGTVGGLTWNTLVNVPGYTLKGTLDDSVGRNIVGPRFVETLGLTLIAGRDFDMRDTGRSPATVIVNESFARHFFGTDDVLGRQISFIDSATRRDTIVGIVRDARDRGIKQPAKPVVYSNYDHDPLGWLTFSVRVAQDPRLMLNEIVSVFRMEDPQVPIEWTRTVEMQIQDALRSERVLAGLSAMLGTLAIVIAMIGLYGLLAYSVARRTREIGIRMALGARPVEVQWLAVRESARLVFLGAVLGVPAYVGVSRLFQAQVYQVRPEDPVAICGVLCLLFVSAGLATYVPASRCARVDPLTALRYE